MLGPRTDQSPEASRRDFRHARLRRLAARTIGFLAIHLPEHSDRFQLPAARSLALQLLWLREDDRVELGVGLVVVAVAHIFGLGNWRIHFFVAEAAFRHLYLQR